MEQLDRIITGNTGLANLGNTCFLNSCLQILCHTEELTKILNSEKIQKNLKNNLQDTTITRLWIELQKVIYDNNKIISPKKFVLAIHRLAKNKKREIFTGWAQNDMSEFLLFMIDCLHNSLSRQIEVKIEGNVKNKTDKLAVECYNMIKTTYEKEYSEIMQLFYGIYVSVLLSTEKQNILSCKPEHFFILDLPIPLNIKNPSIYDCFNLYCKPELLEGDNLWHNEKTGKKEAVYKKTTFWSLPTILIITLNRFDPNNGKKLNTRIDFPLFNLDLSEYIEGYNKSSYIYNLYGVCNHIGGITGGHYTSFVKNNSEQWLLCNDTNINLLKNDFSIISEQAYCLFYRKKNN